MLMYLTCHEVVNSWRYLEKTQNAQVVFQTLELVFRLGLEPWKHRFSVLLWVRLPYSIVPRLEKTHHRPVLALALLACLMR